MSPEQIQQCASSRGIVDYFFCFICDEYVWDCDHLIDERPRSLRVPALERSELQSFAYDGKARVLEIEFRVVASYMRSSRRIVYAAGEKPGNACF
jgi:hypothetical protein